MRPFKAAPGVQNAKGGVSYASADSPRNRWQSALAISLKLYPEIHLTSDMPKLISEIHGNEAKA